MTEQKIKDEIIKIFNDNAFILHEGGPIGIYRNLYGPLSKKGMTYIQWHELFEQNLTFITLLNDVIKFQLTLRQTDDINNTPISIISRTDLDILVNDKLLW